jgi:peptidylprolyl isomerase
MSEKTVQNGQTVNVHYVGTLDDGTVFDDSRTRGEPISFTTGTSSVIPGFDQAVLGMEVGGTKTVTIEPAQAYGDPAPEAVQLVPISVFPDEMELTIGMQVQGSGPQGDFPAVIDAIDDTGVTVNMNHPLAGKTLNFEIEVVSLESE